MGMTTKIIRNAINAFFQSYQSLTSIASLLVFPASASILLCQALASPFGHILQDFIFRLDLMFKAACFPASSKFFAILNLKLSQTIFSFIFTLPFNVTFLLLAKTAIIRIVCESQSRRIGLPSFSSLVPLYCSVLLTYLFNSFVFLSVNATIFALLFIVFNTVEVFGFLTNTAILVLSSAGAVLYSIVISNTMVVCNLALIVSANDKCSGYLSFLKASMMIRGRVMTALALTMPANLGMAAIEALFAYRVMRQYNLLKKLNSSVIWEAFTITYIHAVLVVFDVIVSCMFFKSYKTSISCCSSSEIDIDHHTELEPEEKGSLQV